MLVQRRTSVPTIGLSTIARRFTLDHLWVITVLALTWAFISVLPLPPNDLWWHMAAGRTTLAEGTLIHTNRWAYTVPFDAPYVYQSWISEILLYGVWWIGDVPLLTLTRSLVIVLSYGLVAWHAWRRSKQGKAVALALLLAVLVSWDNWTLRPQTLALLPGAAFAVVIGEYLGGRVSARWLAALPALMALWVNMHGSFIMGAALLAFVWAGTALETVRSPRNLRPEGLRQLKVWTVVGAATFLSMMANPLGFGIFGYVRNLFANSSVQNRIAEWQPMRNDISLHNTGFWFFGVLLLLTVLMAAGPRRPSAIDLLWYCGLAWMGISAGRHAMWFALFLLPLIAEQLTPLFAARHPTPGNSTINLAYLSLLGVMCVAMLPWFSPARYLGPNSEHLYATDGPYRMLLSSTTPIAATEWLRTHPIAGRFWTDMSYTSYTTWIMPEKQIFSDLRIELFPDSVWDDYFDIAGGDERSLTLINQWQITHLLLDRNGQSALYQLLLDEPGWCERYKDSQSVIMARCN